MIRLSFRYHRPRNMSSFRRWLWTGWHFQTQYSNLWAVTLCGVTPIVQVGRRTTND